MAYFMELYERRDGPQSRDPQNREPAQSYKELAGKYAKTYPDSRTFHITTDMQVFLEGDLSLAQMHQRTLGEGQVVTIKTK